MKNYSIDKLIVGKKLQHTSTGSTWNVINVDAKNTTLESDGVKQVVRNNDLGVLICLLQYKLI